MAWICFDFAPWMTEEKWNLKLCWTFWMLWASAPKINTLREPQMLQHVKMIISMKNGTCSLVLETSKSWNDSMLLELFRPIVLQHWMAKGHLKKRCSTIPLYLFHKWHNHSLLGPYFFFVIPLVYWVCFAGGAKRKFCGWADKMSSKANQKHGASPYDLSFAYMP